jgi:cytochrome c-type biogenesis protein CcmH
MLVSVALVASGTMAMAFEPDEVLKDKGLEARARVLSAQLRCLVCQNQSIDDSNASLARDLRLLVRERLVDGDTDLQVLEFIVARYGEFVLLKPRIMPSTYILWFAPAGLLLIGGIGVAMLLRRRVIEARTATPQALSKDEEKQLEKLLNS